MKQCASIRNLCLRQLSSNATSEQGRQRLRGPRKKRFIVTLDPTKLVQLQQPAIDMSDLAVTRIWTASGLSKLTFACNARRIPFPSGTRGFLYYHLPSDRPRISGQLRFRLTPSDDPASFAYGHDLMQPRDRRYTHQPWGTHVLYLPDQMYYTGLLSQLVNEGLVEESLLETIRRVRAIRGIGGGPVNFLFNLSDPWELNYYNNPRPRVALRAVTESGQGHILYLPLYVRSRIVFKSGM